MSFSRLIRQKISSPTTTEEVAVQPFFMGRRFLVLVLAVTLSLIMAYILSGDRLNANNASSQEHTETNPEVLGAQNTQSQTQSSTNTANVTTNQTDTNTSQNIGHSSSSVSVQSNTMTDNQSGSHTQVTINGQNVALPPDGSITKHITDSSGGSTTVSVSTSGSGTAANSNTSSTNIHISSSSEDNSP